MPAEVPGPKTETARGRIAANFALAGIVCLSLLANVWNNDFPLGYHFDEPKKVDFILSGQQDFLHPLLMLQVGRLVNWFASIADPQGVVELGRSISAVFATAAVIAAYRLFAFAGGRMAGLLTAALVAASPMIITHAHYLKEDVYVVFFLLLALDALLRWLASPTGRGNLIYLGIALGLAIASKYNAAILLIPFALAPRLGAMADRRRHLRGFGGACLIAAAVFLLVNYPLFSEPDRFLMGFLHELGKTERGEFLKIYPLQSLFAFHWLNSIGPGMTWPAAVVGVLGMALVLAGRGQCLPADRILISFVAIYYLSIELAGSKPYPGFVRYAMPLTPILSYYAARALLWHRRPSRALMIAATVVIIAVPADRSARIVRDMASDTRGVAAQRMAELSGGILREPYTSARWNAPPIGSLSWPQIKAAGVRHVATSSFIYDRVAYGRTLLFQAPEVELTAQRYEALFRCPFEEIRADTIRFGYGNPTIRIIDLDGCPDDLAYP